MSNLLCEAKHPRFCRFSCFLLCHVRNGFLGCCQTFKQIFNKALYCSSCINSGTIVHGSSLMSFEHSQTSNQGCCTECLCRSDSSVIEHQLSVHQTSVASYQWLVESSRWVESGRNGAGKVVVRYIKDTHLWEHAAVAGKRSTASDSFSQCWL